MVVARRRPSPAKGEHVAAMWGGSEQGGERAVRRVEVRVWGWRCWEEVGSEHGANRGAAMWSRGWGVGWGEGCASISLGS